MDLFAVTLGEEDTRRDRMEMGLGIWSEDESMRRFYPFDTIRSEGALIDEVGGRNLLVYFDRRSSVPAAVFVDAVGASVEGQDIRLDSGQLVTRGEIVDAGGNRTAADRPNQVFTRWYGFSLTFPNPEVLVTLKRPPQRIFSGREFDGGAPNHLRFRMSPNVEIALGASVMAAGRQGELEDVELFARRDPRLQVEPYELVLGAAMAGDHLLFARQDEVEEAWRIVDLVLAEPPALHAYEPGTWGPIDASRLIALHADWHDPLPAD